MKQSTNVNSNTKNDICNINKCTENNCIQTNNLGLVYRVLSPLHDAQKHCWQQCCRWPFMQITNAASSESKRSRVKGENALGAAQLLGRYRDGTAQWIAETWINHHRRWAS